MNKSEFLSSIRGTWELLNKRLKIADAIINTGSLSVDQGFNAVALDRSSSYERIYRSALSRSYYNIILNDEALFQFSWASSSSWRLAYLPNPWLTGYPHGLETRREAQTMVELGDLTLEEFDEVMASLDVSNAVPPIRYEYALDQHREVLHPAAHFHIGRHTENRWAVNRRLSPKAFCMLVAAQYYNESWNSLSSFAYEDVPDCIDAEFIATLNDCGVVPYFTDAEHRLLHFTSN